MLQLGFSAGDRVIESYIDTHPAACGGFGSVGAYHCAGASVAGKSHRRRFRARDDAFAMRSAGRFLAVSVADGVGAYRHSRYGSTFAVSTVTCHLLALAVNSAPPAPRAERVDSGIVRDLLRRESGSSGLPRFGPGSVPGASDLADGAGCGTLAWYSASRARVAEAELDESLEDEDSPHVAPVPSTQAEIMRQACIQTHEDLRSFAAGRSLRLDDVPTTLLAILFDTESGEVTSAQIGDGLAACHSPGNGFDFLVEAPQHEEPGMTYFFTQPDWQDYLAIRSYSPEQAAKINAFFLMTDGVSNDCPKLPGPELFEPLGGIDALSWPSVQTSPARTMQLLDWLSTYEQPDSADDRTLLAVWKNR